MRTENSRHTDRESAEETGPALRDEVREALDRSSGAPRVTVVKPGALGDTLLAMPALQCLLRAAPAAELTLLGSAWAQRLTPLLAFPLRVVRFDSPAVTPLFAPEPRDEEGVFRDADLVLIYTARREDPLVAAARALCNGSVIRWPVEPPGPGYASAHFAAALLQEPTLEALPCPALRPPQEPRPADRPVALHPGSGGARKCWPPESFARLSGELARQIADDEPAGRPAPEFLLLEGPADDVACRRVLARRPEGVVLRHRSGLSVRQAAGLIAGCRLFVGNDSGLSHLAAALGTPTVAVFGPTEPRLWAPRGPAARAVGGGGEWPTVEAALRACRRVTMDVADARSD
ncbi:MAG: glycosyltransferase family 9 protein [Planctomycetota bacterium]